MSSLWSHRLTPVVTFVLGSLVAVTLTGHAKSGKSPARGGKIAGAVIPLEAAPRRVAPSNKASIQILATGHNAFLGVLRMKANGKVPKHRDATEEYIYVLEGTGTVTIDGAASPVAPGTTIFMPAMAEVSFVGGDTPLVAIQVFAGPGPSAKYDAWTRAPATPPKGSPSGR